MKNNIKNWVIGLIIASIIVLGLMFSSNNLPFYVGANGEVVQLALPHYGSFECKNVESKFGLTINVPSGGSTISKSTVGFYTNGISNIKLSFSNSYWSTDWGTRVIYNICDTNGNNCGADTIISDFVGGRTNIPISSLNFAQQSIRLRYQRLPFYIIGGWQSSTGLQATYDANRYALVYHSTTYDVAGAVVCSTSCDLNCPDIGVRNKLIFVTDNILGFGATAPSFEYWESIPYDLNTQGGATVYNANTNTFCFSGTVYTAKTTKMESGTTYIYPDVNTRQSKLCCPGATISSTYSDKVCNSDGNSWRVIQDTDKITCISDATCPNAGNQICQNRQLSGGYSCTNKDANGIGLCVRASGTPVSCCNSADCNTDMVCDISSHTCKGGTIYPVCGNGKLEAGEQCDDGNTVSGDKCSSICQSEITCSKDTDCKTGEKCDNGRCVQTTKSCNSCEDFAISKLIGGVWKDKQCSNNLLGKIMYNMVTCSLTFVKVIGIPILFILLLVILPDILRKIKSIKKKEWAIWTISALISLGVSVLLWYIWYLAVILFIVLIIIKIMLK